MINVSDFSTADTLGDPDLFAQKRAAIDLIATTRARVIRIALFGAYLFRVHPTRPEDEDTRDEWRSILSEQADDVSRKCALLNGTDPLREIAPEICTWLGDYGNANATSRAGFEKMRDLSNSVVRAAHGTDSRELERALHAHLVYGRGGFFEVATTFCDGLWKRLDADRHSDIEKASRAAAAITKTLHRLEHIGKHVRLVSLNASVEAARVGDAGRGLGVIAVEFKTLAEEIQQLATTARNDVSAMGRPTDHS